MRKALIIITLFALVGVVLLWATSRRQPDLLAVATRVARLDRWEIERGPDSCKAFFWSSPSEVVHLAEERTTHGPYTNVGFYRLDARTGLSTRLDFPSKAFRRADPADVVGSPDGRWALWRTDSGLLAVSTDGQQRRKSVFAEKRYGNIVWLSDSRHFLSLEPCSHHSHYEAATLYDIEYPTLRKRLLVDEPNPLNHNYYNTDMLSVGERLFVVQKSDSDWWDRPTGSVWSYVIGLRQSFPKLQEHHIRLPERACLQNAVISPDGTRIAWQFGFVYPPPLPETVYRWIPSLRADPQRVAALWVSRLDGTEMRSLGSLTIDPKIEGPYQLEGLRWLPDGKRLSFITQKPDSQRQWVSTLYTLFVGE